jgi:DNA-binding PadR family transcriptional regulator
MDVKTVCLGVLSLGDATGYEIKKLFEDGPFSHFYEAGYGSIYPALNNLLEQGLVSCTAQEQDGRPAKKVYSLTAAGEVALRDALHKPPQRDKIRSESLVMLFFGHLLEAGRRRGVFESYLRHFEEILSELEARDIDCADQRKCFVHGFGLAVYGAAAKYLADNAHLFRDESDSESDAVSEAPAEAVQ